jgi:hypothetical protein
MNLDFSKVVPTAEMGGGTDEETEELKAYLNEAESEINFYSWHDGIVRSYFGMGIGGIFAIFLFEILPNRKNVDNFVWVIVGDLPSAYITCETAPNPACALDCYICAMEEWVEAAKIGKSVENLIPVNVPATPENGLLLETRLKFLDEKILVNHKADLDE